MPFIHNTPESLIPRSDSKNPASTCRGLTSNGRPCRRALASPRSSPAGSPSGSPQRIPSDEAFCWQHKDQAQNGATAPQGLQSHTIKERTSVDTLVDRLGFLEVSQNEKGKRRRKPGHEKPSSAEGGESNGTPQLSQRPDRPQHSSRPRPEERSNLGLFCCIIPIEPVAEEGSEAPRPAIHNSHGGRTSASMPKPTNAQPLPTHTSTPSPAQPNLSPGRPNRPSLGRDPSSRTGEFLSLIPQTTTPETTALLLAELAKPVSASDDEGFIYMFWLTPEALPSEPPSEAARSLLAPPSRPEPGRRRTSDVLDSFASVTASTRGIDSTDRKTILLKIGRAANVQRRLNQWTRQCGYNLSLIRYYPYHPSSSPGNEVPKTPRKLPYANKVERLIHIELKGKRAKENENGGKCASCGREHREWFEVEADREGVRAVDEVIRRWVDWGEKLP